MSLLKSRFIEMFVNSQFPLLTIGDTFKTTSGGTPSKSYSAYYKDGDIPWLTSGEVNAGVISSPKNYITKLGMENSSAKYVPAKSVVIAMYGATAGQSGLLEYESTTNQAVCSIFPREGYIPEYIYYAVKEKKQWMKDHCDGGAQPNISQSLIKRMKIIDAPLEAQRKYVEFVKQIDKSKFNVFQDQTAAQVKVIVVLHHIC